VPTGGMEEAVSIVACWDQKAAGGGSFVNFKCTAKWELGVLVFGNGVVLICGRVWLLRVGCWWMEVWWCEYVPICFVEGTFLTCVTIRSQSQHIAIRDHDHHIML